MRSPGSSTDELAVCLKETFCPANHPLLLKSQWFRTCGTDYKWYRGLEDADFALSSETNSPFLTFFDNVFRKYHRKPL